VAVRVKLRIKSRLEAGVEVETVALVNSGFEADAPEIVIPMRLAERLNLRSRLLEARVEPYNTVAGPIRMYVLPSSIEVEVVEEDNRSPTVVCDAVISDTEIEVLISDYLAGALGIVVEDFRDGIWRLKSDPPTRQRRTYKPQHWI
jgi:hypothetical protein